jgi:UDP-GlcNAc:undecaprenyl-phosphate/decaprenyl-phosphate GlcNAc-1-phosphate transferase
MTHDLGLAGGAFVASLVATPLVTRFALRIGFVDHPGPLKPHARATPYLGGVGLAIGLGLGVAVVDPWLLVPLGLALALGTVDDLRPLPPAIRLLGEVAIGLVVAAVVSTRFGHLGYLLVPVAAIALVNGFNLLDGLDALCGSVTLVGAAGFSVLLSGSARSLALVLAGATAAFLIFNRPPAKVYLGDGGAYLMGTAMTALLAFAWAPREPRPTAVAALALVALPVAEVGLAMFRRARTGRSLFAGDRDHPYDVLVRSGWSIGGTVAAYAVAELVAVVLGLAASRLASQLAWVVVAFTTLGLLAAGLGPRSGSPHDRSTDELST